jgi:hypothetical protein
VAEVSADAEPHAPSIVPLLPAFKADTNPSNPGVLSRSDTRAVSSCGAV